MASSHQSLGKRGRGDSSANSGRGLGEYPDVQAGSASGSAGGAYPADPFDLPNETSDTEREEKRKKKKQKVVVKPSAQDATQTSARKPKTDAQKTKERNKDLEKHRREGIADHLFPRYLHKDKAPEAIAQLRHHGYINELAQWKGPVMVSGLHGLGKWIQLSGPGGHPKAPDGPYYPQFLPSHPAATINFSGSYPQPNSAAPAPARAQPRPSAPVQPRSFAPPAQPGGSAPTQPRAFAPHAQARPSTPTQPRAFVAPAQPRPSAPAPARGAVPAPASASPVTAATARYAPTAPSPAPRPAPGANVYRQSRDEVWADSWTGPAPPAGQKKVLDDVYPHTEAILWPNRAMIVSSGGRRLPFFPQDPQHKTVFHMDGSMGERDITAYPQLLDNTLVFMAFVPAKGSSEQLKGPFFRPPVPSDWVVDGHLHTVAPKTLAELQETSDRVIRHYLFARKVMEIAIQRDEWEVPHDHPFVRLIKKMEAPVQDAWRVALSRTKLKTGVPSRGVAKLYWSALQRNMRILVGYITCCAVLTPNSDVRSSLESCVMLADETEYCGVIFDDSTDPALYNLFREKGWGAYAIVWTDAYVCNTEGKSVRTRGHELLDTRLDLEMTAAVDDHGYKLGYFVRPPPPGVPWWRFERVLRGIFRWPSAVDMAKVAQDAKEREDRELAHIPGVIMERNGVRRKNQHAVFQSFKTEQEAPKWGPKRPASGVRATTRLQDYVMVLKNENGAAPTLTPLVHTFYSQAKLYVFTLIATVTLWTFLCARLADVIAAEEGEERRSLISKDWRNTLSPHHWKEMRGAAAVLPGPSQAGPIQAVQSKGGKRKGGKGNGGKGNGVPSLPFDPEGEFLQNGSTVLFTKEFSDALKREFAKPPRERNFTIPLGSLSCKCPQTVARVNNDEDLLGELAFALNVLALLWFLSRLAQKALVKADEKVARHRYDEFRLPDFSKPASDDEPRVVQLIRRLVLNGGDIAGGKWPALWSGVEHPDLSVRGAWVKDLREFVCMWADNSEVFETGGEIGEGMPNWSATKHAGDFNASGELREPFDEATVIAYEQEMLDRLYVLALMAGIKPVEFLKAPTSAYPFGCRMCRKKAAGAA